MTHKSRIALSFAVVAVLVIPASGCLRYQTYRVKTGGPDIVLRRVDGDQSPASDPEIPVPQADPKYLRTVESLQGARIRLRAPERGDIDGDVVWTATDSIGVQTSRNESAIEDSRGASCAVALGAVETLEVADSKGEAAVTAAIVVGVIAAAVAAFAHSLGAANGN